jgi:hypothetical protein
MFICPIFQSANEVQTGITVDRNVWVREFIALQTQIAVVSTLSRYTCYCYTHCRVTCLLKTWLWAFRRTQAIWIENYVITLQPNSFPPPTIECWMFRGNVTLYSSFKTYRVPIQFIYCLYQPCLFIVYSDRLLTALLASLGGRWIAKHCAINS